MSLCLLSLFASQSFTEKCGSELVSSDDSRDGSANEAEATGCRGEGLLGDVKSRESMATIASWTDILNEEGGKDVQRNKNPITKKVVMPC